MQKKTDKQVYQHQAIEKKWQRKWREQNLYKTADKTDKPKYYVLDMFPYPSGAGLHVGHPKGYIATDIVARQKMMQGYNVLHPMGWDAFGLPAENYALKNKVQPAVATAENVETFKKQLEILGFTYDWEREVNTTDPHFYRWTQWIFLQLYGSYYDQRLGKAQPIGKLIEKKFGTSDYYALTAEQKVEIDAQRLAFEEYAPINWCPSCKTGLANEDLEDGKCERCGSVIEKKPMRQWSLRITRYADRLLQDLRGLDWEEFIKTMQTNWIGKSVGAEVEFVLQAEPLHPDWHTDAPGFKNEIVAKAKVFTTRVDTIYGVTYVVLAPEKVQAILGDKAQYIKNWDEVMNYVEKSRRKSEQDRLDVTKEKTGVQIKGLGAFLEIGGRTTSKKPIDYVWNDAPVWVADYVLGDYGTGAVMAVPAHDERDWEFAKKYGLPIETVIYTVDEYARYQERKKHQFGSYSQSPQLNDKAATTADGVLVNSGKYNGMASSEARKRITADLAGKGVARERVNYKLREWVFSRQRYWGEPIPIIHCAKCGNVPVPEAELPLRLPEVAEYEPSGTGESPLVKIKDWVEVRCPHCGGRAKRETNTMPQWAGSSWYYLRYIDPHNDQALIDPAKERYMMPVDFYVGGAEHATRHLIYARFWHKFLYDLGVVSTLEPFTKLQHVGLILAEDGRKMSKRWHNVINPDEIVAQYGADAMRVYEMFMAPFGAASAWNTQGLVGCRKFLDKVVLFGDFFQPGKGLAGSPGLDFKVVETKLAHCQTSDARDSRTLSRTLTPDYLPLLHQTIRKVTQDMAAFKLNTVVSALMILTNKMLEEKERVRRENVAVLLQLLAPVAPHLAEEMWERLGHKESIFCSKWPEYDEKLAQDKTVMVPVQINGKLRDQVEVAAEQVGEEEQVWELILAREKVRKYLAGKEIKKKIYVRGKIANLVIGE